VEWTIIWWRISVSRVDQRDQRRERETHTDQATTRLRRAQARKAAVARAAAQRDQAHTCLMLRAWL
jgi:hypothetical protein